MSLKSAPPKVVAPFRSQILVAMMAVFALALSVFTPLIAHAEERALRLDRGHVDAFNFMLDDSGAPVLNLKEDVTGSHVTHDPETVDLVVKEQAKLTLPAAAAIPSDIQGTEGYYLPLSQDHNLLWPGWDSQQLLGSGFDSVDIVIDSVQGPGDVHIWSFGSFGNLIPLMTDGEGQPATKAPATIRQNYLAHVHANWFFTSPGEYHLQVYGIAYNSETGESVRTNSSDYQFTVGDFTNLNSVSIDGVAEQYDTGDSIELNAVTDPAAEGVEYSWETLVNGAWERVPGADGPEFSQEASVDQQIRVVASLHGNTVVSEPVTITVVEPTPMPTALSITGLDNPYAEGESVSLTATPDVGLEGATFRWETSTDGEVWQVDDFTSTAAWTGEAADGLQVRATLVFEGDDIITSEPVQIAVEDPVVLPESVVLTGLDNPYAEGEPVSLTATPDVGLEGATFRWETSTDGEVWQVDDFTSTAAWTGEAADGLQVRATLVFEGEDIITSEPVAIELKPADDEPNGDSPQCYALDLDRGHVDAFNVTMDGKDPVLTLKEDVTGSHVVRSPSEVNLVVKDSALLELPSVPAVPDSIQGVEGYYLPITQDQNLLWPGWDSQSLAGSGYDTVDINIEAVDGPGNVHIWGGAKADGFHHLAYDSTGDPATQLPATIKQDYLAHVHANWFFTEPGAYRLTVTATAHNSETGKSAETNTEEYVFSVGDFEYDAADYLCPQETIVDVPGNGDEEPVDPNPSDRKPADLDPESKDPADRVPGSKDPANPLPSIQDPAGPGAGKPITSQPVPVPSGKAPAPSDVEVCLPLNHPDAPELKSATTSGGATDSDEDSAPAPHVTKSPGIVGTEGHFDFGPAYDNGGYSMKVKDDRTAPPVWRDARTVVFELDDDAKRAAGEIPDELSFIADGSQDVWMIQQIQEAGVPWLGWNTQHESVVNGPGSNGVDLTLESVNGPGEMAIFLNGSFGQLVGQRVVDTVGGPTTYRIPANTHQHGNWVFTEPGHYEVTFTLSADGESVTDTLSFAVGVPAIAPVGGSAGGDSAGGSSDSGATEEAAGQGQNDPHMGVTPDGEPCLLDNAELAYAGAPFDARPVAASGLMFILAGGMIAWMAQRRGKRIDA